jgi:alpha-L-fucosidase 2
VKLRGEDGPHSEKEAVVTAKKGMLAYPLIGIVAALWGSAAVAAFDLAAELDRQNVVWDAPSRDAHGSMPLGNGDVGVNAWVEPSGDVVFYIDKTDAWDENGRLCKIGRVRVAFDPPLAPGSAFEQALLLRDGVIAIRATIGGAQAKIRLWVDAEEPVVRVEAETGVPVRCRAAVELWRLRERPFGDQDDSHSGGGLGAQPFKPVVLPDVVVKTDAPRIVWYHRNTRSLFPECLRNQHLEALRGQLTDPLLLRTFGASVTGEGFIADGALALKSGAPAARHELRVCVLAERAETPERWLARLAGIEQRAAKTDVAASRAVTKVWWREFWCRSWVVVEENGAKAPSAVTRGYVLQRFMNACAGRGGAPIKFNGSMFTVEKTPGAAPETPDGDPDWRQWGSNYWFQNTRPSYWTMLPAGDFDMLAPWFRMYLDGLALSKARVRTYYKFENAAVFPETMSFWGLPNNNDYGWGNREPEPANGYIKRYWSGCLELIAVLLDRYDYTQDEDFARTTLVPLADPLVSFLDQYWKRDASGKIRFDPAQSLETWHVAVNPLPEIAGLKFLLPRLLALPARLATAEQRQRWQRLLGELPPIPVREIDGRARIQPADSFDACANSENPELYAVFPFRLFGVGREGLELARDTFAVRRNRHNSCWCQDSIQAACLGLGEDAGRMLGARAAAVNGAYRFPAMWGPFNDWIPDQDHGCNIQNTLNFMLLQSDGDRLFVLPAWPKAWNVSFKLHAPRNTVVEGEVRDGKVIALAVTPKVRAADVVVMFGK